MTSTSPGTNPYVCLPNEAPENLLAYSVVAVEPIVGMNVDQVLTVVHIRTYARPGGGKVNVGWLQGEPVWYDPAPDDPNVPGYVNSRWVTADRNMRSVPEGPCRWRFDGEQA